MINLGAKIDVHKRKVIIGTNSVIGAGAVVVKDVLPINH